jgi:hypothetical protein
VLGEFEHRSQYHNHAALVHAAHTNRSEDEEHRGHESTAQIHDYDAPVGNGRWTMATLDTKDREKLRSSQFAYIDKQGGEHLPINDASHVRNAIARFNQTEFESQAAKERARKKILSAAERHDIDVEEGSNIRKPTRSLRAASTKRGPRGGRKKTD